MQRRCFLLQVKPGRLQEYLQAHQVWPEMLEAMRAVGLSNYSMFYRPDGMLVGYLEGEDIADSLRRLKELPVEARWQEGMAPFFEAGGSQELTEYFYMA